MRALILLGWIALLVWLLARSCGTCPPAAPTTPIPAPRAEVGDSCRGA